MKYTISYFTCPECGMEIPLPRPNGRKRKRGHIKDLFCPRCGKIQKTLEHKAEDPVANES
jgi:predicted RNA-binding Zn-ribbon protein involved in translation (DUF1610 family)